MIKNPFVGHWLPALAAASGGRTSRLAGRQRPVSWLLSAGDGDEERTVRTGRRRRSDAPGPEGRERAEAPQRRDAPSSTPPPSGGIGSGGGGGGTFRPSGSGPLRPSGGGLPMGGGKMSPLMIIVLLIAAAIFIGPQLFGGGGGEPGLQPTQEPILQAPLATSLPPLGVPSPTRAPVATAAAAPTRSSSAAPAAGSPGQRWLIMFYQDADDKVLEQDIYLDLNEAEQVGSSGQVRLVAQVDRFKGGFQADGNWTGTRRYELTPDTDLGRVSSTLVEDLGEVNMSAGDTLADFVTWAAQTYPADKYVLIMSDHGLGWPGGWSDPDPGSQSQTVDRSIPLAQALGDELYLNEMDDALAKARQQAGIDKFELIGMDACLMGHLEVVSALEPHGRFAVVSQETEPAVGWAYTAFLTTLARNPGMTGAELGAAIVESYIDQDERVVNDQQREEWVGRGQAGGFYGGAPSAEQLAGQLGRAVTLTAVDLARIPDVMNKVNDLAYQLQGQSQQAVAKARNYTQSFTSIFGPQVPPSYIDLGHFAYLLKQVSNDANVNAASDAVLLSLRDAIIAEKHGADKPGATGLSVYFPNSQLYKNPSAGPQSYTAIAQRFAQNSLWDDFLGFHYAGRQFEPGARLATVPEQSAITQAPGAGTISATPIEKSADSVAIRDTVLLSTRVTGENVGYIYFFTGYLDRASNSIYVADRDYLEAPQTREVEGVFYPDWGEGAFNLEFEWEPLAYAITDGETRVQAALQPETYGASYEDTVYSVDGTYTYAEDGVTRQARAYFRDGILRQVFAFTQTDGTGAPREISVQNGDTFTVKETWLEPDGQGGTREVYQDGDTIRFTGQPIEWQELDAAAGDYIVGFIIEDLDGNKTEVFTTVRVQ